MKTWMHTQRWWLSINTGTSSALEEKPKVTFIFCPSATYIGWSWYLSLRTPRLRAGKVKVWGFRGCKVMGPSGSRNLGAENGVGESLYSPLSYTATINIPLLFSRSVMSDSLRPHRLWHARLACLSLFPGVCSNSCSFSQRCRELPWWLRW